jgi:hypothetical protein
VELPDDLVYDLEGFLSEEHCGFWACPGPNEPFKDMATCGRCAVLQPLRAAIKDAKRPKEDTNEAKNQDQAIEGRLDQDG